MIALVALAALSAAGYRIFQHEQRLSADTQALASSGDAANVAIETIGEIKAALHAYVAPGQGQPFWTARAGMLLDKLRGSLLELDRVAAANGAPVTETLDLSDRLAAAEQRAREHIRNGQPLLAGEVIFTDARDLLDAIRVQVARARGQLAQTSGARLSAARREQLMVATAAVGIAAVALLILVPPGRAHDTVALSASPSTSRAGGQEPEEYARVVPTAKATAVAASSTTSATTASGVRRTATAVPAASVARPASSATGSSSAKAVPAARPATEAPPTPPPPGRWPEAATLCTDIARVSDSQEIGALLGRAAALLNASGIVLWMASDARDGLAPAATSGYDERLVSRIGSISRDDDNLTANAFREIKSRTSKARQGSAAALAVPLVAPSGAVGVLSAELRESADVDPQQLAIATIVAAQLSMLLANASVAAPAADTVAGEARQPEDASPSEMAPAQQTAQG